MFEFGYIWAFALFPLPFLLYWLLPAFKQRKEALRYPLFQQTIEASGKKAKSKAWIAKRNVMQWILLTLVWISLLTALASPQIVGEPEMKVKTARNFVIAADISFSMANTDWFIDGKRVTRWEGVKQVMREFIQQRQSDRLALVFFGTNAYLQAPLTTDHEVIKFMLEETDVGMAGQMTSIGKAIGYSLQIFEGDSLDQKVLLLLTDGQDDGRGIFPTDAARMAHQDSVKIYTIGIGEPTGTNSGLDESTLRSIANIAEGQYFLAQDAEQLEQAYITLNQLEPVEFEEEENKPVTLLYHYPLTIGMCLAFALSFFRGIIKLFKG
ncbi:VWA domain-containing protein [Carboxylicivirga sp. A043]|uniref:VWA domain-containing protein n=1 Tax=Carboxylicivirga litoralis TaxID=2816963 RepID=UPI0021CB49A3|nr:VWA domain-containing protein [Carboxylicivirga sp. A043]MCU4156301.1 VWA domain-containing protein [Carboxylicivirga sp. A043]